MQSNASYSFEFIPFLLIADNHDNDNICGYAHPENIIFEKCILFYPEFLKRYSACCNAFFAA
jgi:hypothetical protein